MAQTAEVGFRDNFGIGIGFITMNGLFAEAQIPIAASDALRLEGGWGAGVATWGLAEQWQVTGSLLFSTTDDKVNDALLIEPGLMYGAMIGDSNRGFLDFSPNATVHFIALVCGIAWVHEYQSWSIELALRPGESFGFDGQNPGQAFGWGSDTGPRATANGETSFQMCLSLLARF